MRTSTVGCGALRVRTVFMCLSGALSSPPEEAREAEVAQEEVIPAGASARTPPSPSPKARHP